MDARLTIDQSAGFVPETELASLEIRDWAHWLRMRTREFDTLTNQVLTGLSDRFRVIRESIIRTANTTIQTRFADGAWLLIREIINEFRSQVPSDRSAHAETALLFGLLELLRSLPREVSLSSSALESSVDLLKEFSLRAPLSAHNTGEMDAARVSAVHLLDHMHVALEADFERLLEESNLAGNIVLPLLRQQPKSAARILAKSYNSLSRAGVHEYFNSVLELAEKDATDKRIAVDPDFRLALIDTRANIDPEFRYAFDGEPEVVRLLGESPVISWIRRNEQVRFVDVPYVPDWEKEGNAASKLSGRLIGLVNESENRYYPEHKANLSAPWDFNIQEVSQGECICRAPVFLTSTRTRHGITVVPFGLLTKLSIVYVKRPIAGALETQVRAVHKSLLDLNSLVGIEIGTLGGTSADTEIKDVEIQLNRTLNPTRLFNVDELANWLCVIRDASLGFPSRIVAIDTGFVPQMLDRFNDYMRATFIPPLLKDSTLGQKSVPYRNPLLVGIAVPESDYRWGTIVRKAVAEVLYKDLSILKNSELAQNLRSVGIEPLGPELLQEARPAIKVRDYLLPFSLDEEAHGANSGLAAA